MTLLLTILAFLIVVISVIRSMNKTMEISELKGIIKKQHSDFMKNTPPAGSTIPMSHFREVLNIKDLSITKLSEDLEDIRKELYKIKSAQQSKSVRLGLISENVLPFNSNFKYEVKDLVPMFNPIDYIVFAEDEIVFLEIKMGTGQLTDKQRKIRGLIDSGRVRFEEYRVTEDGHTTKGSGNNGKESQT